MRGGIRRLFPGVALLLLALALPAAAPAAVRYAAPGGTGPSGPGGCPDTNPCSLPLAVAGTAPTDVVNGDEVVVTAGPYTESAQIFAFDNITVHGEAGQPRPVINSNVATAFGTNVGATFRRLQVEHTGANNAILVFPGTLDDVVVHTTGVSASACTVNGNSTIRNSSCWTSGSSGVGMLLGNGASSETIVVRNVTAVATGATNTDAIRAANSSGVTTTVNATNVIAQATADPPESSVISDIEASAIGAGSVVNVNLDHSNYEDVFPQGSSGGSATITSNATNGNQGAVPLLADPATGDFHQLLGSPTIDAGVVDPANGTTDLDGQPRQIGTSTDIGVDEFPDADSDGIPDSSDGCPNQAGPSSNNGCPIPVPEDPQPDPASGDTAPPDTTISAGPEGKTKKKSATFAFSGTDARAVAGFQCRLDAGAFEPCTSPKTYSKLKKGRHTVEVRAVDAAGNVDPTPATRTWKVKRKKKKR
jgi:hypothetical protein